LEGGAELFGSMLLAAMKKGIRGRLSLLMAKKNIYAFRRSIDYAEYGGAPLLGIDGNVIIGHGKSTPLAISNAISLAYIMASAQIDSKIAAYMKLKGNEIENEDIRDGIKPSRKDLN